MRPNASRGIATICYFVFLTSTTCSANRLDSLTTCNCLGQNVTYECVASGGAFTVWAGSAFMCQAQEISLRHVGFLNTIGECNNGAIIGRGIETTNTSFTSHLYVMLSSELAGRSITCSVEIGSDLILIGTKTLMISEVPFPSPNRTYIEYIGPNEILFRWSTVPNKDDCPLFHYNINATNCGICSPSITTSNSSRCTNFTVTDNVTTAYPCNFTVQSVICGNIAGNNISYLLVNLTVPTAPVVRSVPHYSFRRTNLIRLATSIQVVESFKISNEQGIDGSATSYTVTYTDSSSGKVCSSATIMASSCEAEMCIHTFEVSSSSCSISSIITTAVFASNLLGKGGISSPTIATGGNTFVDVKFDTTLRGFSCTFLNQSMSTLMDRKSCIVNITYGTNCDQHLGTFPAAKVGSSVMTTPTIKFIDEESFYCISVSASNGTQTVIVEGTLDLVNIGQQSTTAAIVSSVVVIICIIAATISIIVILYLIIYTRKSEVRIIKFATSKTSSLTDVLQVFKNHGVSILSINTHLHHIGINLETKQGFIDNYIFCTCSEKHKNELQSELEKFNIEFFEESASNQSARSSSGLIKYTVKVSVRNPGDNILEILDIFNGKGIEILGVNTSTGDNSVECKCSKQEEKKILEDLKNLPTASTEFVSLGRWNSWSTSKRRIEYLVRSEASDIARALKVFGDCGVNITEINPDYVKKFATTTPQPVILDPHNLVECVCNEEVREQLFTKLQEEYKAYNIQCLPKTDLPSRNNVNQDYCVVAFSVVHEVGSLARALMAFADLNINILGINTLGCADHSTLQQHLNYKRCKVEFMTNEQQKELIKEIQTTGIVVESTCSIAKQAKTSSLQLLILEEDQNEEKMSIPKALQTVFNVFQMFDITITGYELDCNSICQRQYQHNHVEYICTNAEEVYQVLTKELTATGTVKVLNDFSVDENKPFIRNTIPCM